VKIKNELYAQIKEFEKDKIEEVKENASKSFVENDESMKQKIEQLELQLINASRTEGRKI